jgi:glycosyltransferase involved in cell wall biosynthesis
MNNDKITEKPNDSKTIVMLCQDNRIDRRILDEARSLKNAGWRVTVIAGAPPTIDYKLDEVTYPDIEIIRLKLGYIPKRITEKDGKNLLFSEVDWQKIYFNHNQLLEIGLNYPADVYVAHDLPQVPVAVILANHYEAQVTYDAHELYPEQFSNDIVKANLNSEAESFILPFVDKVIMVNKSGASFMAIKYGIEKPEIILNSPALKADDLPIENTNILRRNLGIDNFRKILLYQGGVARIKNDVRNLEKLMLSMSFVKNENIVLVYMGPAGHGKDELINIAKEKGLYGSRFYYHEPVSQSELLSYTVSADAGVIPYPHIDFNTYFCTPNKLFEFIVSGIPILANSSPELNDFVSGQGIGLNKPMNSIEGIASAIDEFFSTDFETYEQNVKKLSKDYIWDVQGKKIVDIYDSLIKSSSHSSRIRDRIEEVASTLMFKQNNKIGKLICKAFLKNNPDDIEILRLLSNIYFNLGDYKSSRRELLRMLKNNPEDDAGLFFLNKVNDLIYEQDNGFLKDLMGSDSIDFMISDREEDENISPITTSSASDKCDVKITACIFTRNRADYLKESIESVLNQKYPVHELIIVDDCSTDNTHKVVEKYLSENVKLFTNTNHQGISASRNICIKEASGDYLLWIGDDDLLLEDTTERYRTILSQSPDTDIVYGKIEVFDDETGEEITVIDPKDYTISSDSLLADLFKGSGITDGGSLVRKTVYDKIGNYDTQFNRASDNEFWSRAATSLNFHYSDKLVYKYRKHASNVSFSNTVDRSFESVVLRRLLQNYNLQVLFPFLNWKHVESAAQYANIIIAKSLHNNQDYHNALQYLSTLDLGSVSTEVLNLVAYTYLFMGDYEGFESFIHLCNDNGLMPEDILNNLVTNYNSYREFLDKIEISLANKEVNDIKGYFQEAKRLFGYTFNVAYCLGEFYELLKDHKNAYQYFKDAVRMNPLNEKAIIKAAENAEDDKQRNEIVKLSERILKTPVYKPQLVVGESYTQVTPDAVKFSVIIPTYNRKDKLVDAVKSVIGQTVDDLEVIVVNDAGEDVSELIDNIEDERIQLITHAKNKGLAAARNTGLKNASGKYIAFLDDDDLFMKNHLEIALSFLQQGEQVVYTDAERHTYKQYNDTYILAGKSVPYSIDYERNKLLIGNIAPVNCFVFEKDLVDSSGLFDESLPVLEDWEFWLRLAKYSDFKHITTPTVIVNWYDDGSTMTSSKQKEFADTRKLIYDMYRGQLDMIPNKDEIINEFNEIWAQDLSTNIPLASIIVLSYNQIDYTLNFY